MTQGRQKPFLKTIVQAFKGKVSHKINVDSYFPNTEYIMHFFILSKQKCLTPRGLNSLESVF